MDMIGMRSIRISLVTVAVILSGCSANTNSRMGDDPPIWGGSTAGAAKEAPSFNSSSTTSKRPVWRAGKALPPWLGLPAVIPA
jgi:hypothetical protein